MFVLDTDTLTHLWRGKEKVVARVLAAASSSIPLAITTITRIEVLEGRFAAVRTAATGAELAVAARNLAKMEGFLGRYRELVFDDRAVEIFDRLRTVKKLRKSGRADLLIACICLANDAVLVTRNSRDFQPIPNLKLENWAD
jgi:tRNA(fMet)-specific endonuclease VapC